uniref:Dystroglycan 1 n=1 Tax=Arion vulgaris TaxID=1028688 RepID=A0A0B7ABC6_9EUPU
MVVVVKLVWLVLVLPYVVVASNSQSVSDVTVKWAVADSTATVGKLFRLHIPNDAFDGKVLFYTVQTSDSSPLPRWLEFNTRDTVLQGIPSPSDAGQVFLEITAHGKNSQASVTSTIYVRDVPSHTSGAPLRFKSSGPEFIWCKSTEPETVATITIDADMDDLSVSTRLDLLNKFLSHMELHEGMVKMTPVGNRPMHDSSALVSGTGDSLSPKTSGLFISWPVGCGQVREGHFPVLQKLDTDSGNGQMAKVVGYPVIGWQVTNSRFQTPTRKRRQVQVTPTPSVTPILPTKTESKPDMTDDKMTHKMVDVHTPTFIQPTATQPHMTKTDEPIMPTETQQTGLPASKTKEMPAIKPTKTQDQLQPTDTQTGTIDVTCTTGEKPEVKKRFTVLTYQAGAVIDYVIPKDTFEDCEVGGTRGLELNLYLDTDKDIPSDFFLQFDAKNQRIIGLPVKENVGQFKFNLTGKKKSSSLLANSVITFTIEANQSKVINHELAVTVDYNFNKFKASIQDQVNLANRVAGVYGDLDASNLGITTMKPGSVIYGWTNTSVASVGCPSAEINELLRKLVNEDGSLTDNAIEKMKPFVLLGAQAQPAGACEGDDSFPVVVSKPRETTTSDKVVDVTTDKNIAKSEGKDDDDDVWVTTVVPAVVVVVVLIIALIIACILYRRKRKGKMNVEEQNTFINRGAPVIFPYELEEKPSDANKPLLVEENPSAPPQYHRGASESPEPNLGGNYKNLSASSPADDSITEIPERPYEPPPPVTTSTNGKQSRPTHQQQPFSQAPQILP